MARLILKSPYLKPGGRKSPGGYLKYIATREGVEMAEDTSRHLPATSDQQKQIPWEIWTFGNFSASPNYSFPVE